MGDTQVAEMLQPFVCIQSETSDNEIKAKDSDFTIPPLETPFFPTSNCGLTSITRSASEADSVKTC